MEKQQIELFKAIRAEDIDRAKRAYDRGANVNWPLDRWVAGRKQYWGLRVQVKPLGLYLGFSARERWEVPEGEGADRGDTLLMVALKCRLREAVVFLVGCERLNLSCRNESGNTAADIARATGQEFLLQGGAAASASTGVDSTGEALPAWERAGRGTTTQYASVVAAEPSGQKAGPQYATAEPVGEASFVPGGQPTVASVYVAEAGAPNTSVRDHQSHGGGRGPRVRNNVGSSARAGATTLGFF